MATEGLANSFLSSVRHRLLTWVAPGAGEDVELNPRKRPSNLLYDVDEAPQLLMRFAVSIQHIFLMSVGWLYVVVIVNAVGGGTSQAESLIRMSMIAGGIATILQSNRGIIGSGYFCPLSRKPHFPAAVHSRGKFRRPFRSFWPGSCRRRFYRFLVSYCQAPASSFSAGSDGLDGRHVRTAIDRAGCTALRRRLDARLGTGSAQRRGRRGHPPRHGRFHRMAAGQAARASDAGRPGRRLWHGGGERGTRLAALRCAVQ